MRFALLFVYKVDVPDDVMNAGMTSSVKFSSTSCSVARIVGK